MARFIPVFPVGEEVVLYWYAQRPDWKNRVYIYKGYPPRARTKARFTRVLAACPTCATTNVEVDERWDPRLFVPTFDPNLPKLRTLFANYQGLYQLAAKSGGKYYDLNNPLWMLYDNAKNEYGELHNQILKDWGAST